ncbi:hypothetical protein [Streptomyces sp. HB132]|uniref:hypothetical protein n=1 Tax=Streptomyces sp. HB132 TaxID=767388 RepID=UPI001961A3FC|nr:hypothetical protein [Streptomyces sp. HB132]MBM7436801.1 hypothetical protein [Streptomyces sp. HB132]
MTNGQASGGNAHRAAPGEERQAKEADGSRRGIARTALAVMRRDGRSLHGRAALVTGLAALGGLLLTVVGFVAAWPEFTEIRLGATQARIYEDSYAPEGTRVNTMWLILLACLPFLILLLHLACTALQTACARAAAETGESGPRGRFRTVLGVYVLRGVFVWTPLVLGVLVEEYFTTTTFREYTAIVPLWEYPNLNPLLTYGPPLLGLALTLLLRFGWALAPAASANEGLGPLAALCRSWSLTWGRAVSCLRTLAVALPLGGLTVGLYVLLQAAARPTRPGAASLFLEWGPDNTYAAYVAGVLAPIAIALLLTGALLLPLAQTTLVILHKRLAGTGERQAAGTSVTRA